MKILNKFLKLNKSIFYFFKYKLLFGNNLKIHLINSINGKVNILVKKTGTCLIGKFLRVDGPLYLKVEANSKIMIGNNCYFNHNCSITALDTITIGDNCMFGNNVVIVDHDHSIENKEISTEKYDKSKVRIGNNVWIGANSVVLQGVEIGNNSIVAAGAVVTHSIPSKEVWGGIPAKKIREIN